MVKIEEMQPKTTQDALNELGQAIVTCVQYLDHMSAFVTLAQKVHEHMCFIQNAQDKREQALNAAEAAASSFASTSAYRSSWTAPDKIIEKGQGHFVEIPVPEHFVFTSTRTSPSTPAHPLLATTNIGKEQRDFKNLFDDDANLDQFFGYTSEPSALEPKTPAPTFVKTGPATPVKKYTTASRKNIENADLESQYDGDACLDEYFDHIPMTSTPSPKRIKLSQNYHEQTSTSTYTVPAPASNISIGTTSSLSINIWQGIEDETSSTTAPPPKVIRVSTDNFEQIINTAYTSAPSSDITAPTMPTTSSLSIEFYQTDLMVHRDVYHYDNLVAVNHPTTPAVSDGIGTVQANDTLTTASSTEDNLRQIWNDIPNSAPTSHNTAATKATTSVMFSSDDSFDYQHAGFTLIEKDNIPTTAPVPEQDASRQTWNAVSTSAPTAHKTAATITSDLSTDIWGTDLKSQSDTRDAYYDKCFALVSSTADIETVQARIDHYKENITTLESVILKLNEETQITYGREFDTVDNSNYEDKGFSLTDVDSMSTTSPTSRQDYSRQIWHNDSTSVPTADNTTATMTTTSDMSTEIGESNLRSQFDSHAAYYDECFNVVPSSTDYDFVYARIAQYDENIKAFETLIRDLDDAVHISSARESHYQNRDIALREEYSIPVEKYENDMDDSLSEDEKIPKIPHLAITNPDIENSWPLRVDRGIREIADAKIEARPSADKIIKSNTNLGESPNFDLSYGENDYWFGRNKIVTEDKTDQCLAQQNTESKDISLLDTDILEELERNCEVARMQCSEKLDCIRYSPQFKKKKHLAIEASPEKNMNDSTTLNQDVSGNIAKECINDNAQTAENENSPNTVSSSTVKMENTLPTQVGKDKPDKPELLNIANILQELQGPFAKAMKECSEKIEGVSDALKSEMNNTSEIDRYMQEMANILVESKICKLSVGESNEGAVGSVPMLEFVQFGDEDKQQSKAIRHEDRKPLGDPKHDFPNGDYLKVKKQIDMIKPEVDMHILQKLQSNFTKAMIDCSKKLECAKSEAISSELKAISSEIKAITAPVIEREKPEHILPSSEKQYLREKTKVKRLQRKFARAMFDCSDNVRSSNDDRTSDVDDYMQNIANALVDSGLCKLTNKDKTKIGPMLEVTQFSDEEETHMNIKAQNIRDNPIFSNKKYDFPKKDTSKEKKENLPSPAVDLNRHPGLRPNLAQAMTDSLKKLECVKEVAQSEMKTEPENTVTWRKRRRKRIKSKQADKDVSIDKPISYDKFDKKKKTIKSKQGDKDDQGKKLSLDKSTSNDNYDLPKEDFSKEKQESDLSSPAVDLNRHPELQPNSSQEMTDSLETLECVQEVAQSKINKKPRHTFTSGKEKKKIIKSKQSDIDDQGKKLSLDKSTSNDNYDLPKEDFSKEKQESDLSSPAVDLNRHPELQPNSSQEMTDSLETLECVKEVAQSKINKKPRHTFTSGKEKKKIIKSKQAVNDVQEKDVSLDKPISSNNKHDIPKEDFSEKKENDLPSPAVNFNNHPELHEQLSQAISDSLEKLEFEKVIPQSEMKKQSQNTFFWRKKKRKSIKAKKADKDEKRKSISLDKSISNDNYDLPKEDFSNEEQENDLPSPAVDLNIHPELQPNSSEAMTGSLEKLECVKEEAQSKINEEKQADKDEQGKILSLDKSISNDNYDFPKEDFSKEKQENDLPSPAVDLNRHPELQPASSEAMTGSLEKLECVKEEAQSKINKDPQSKVGLRKRKKKTIKSKQADKDGQGIDVSLDKSTLYSNKHDIPKEDFSEKKENDLPSPAVDLNKRLDLQPNMSQAMTDSLEKLECVKEVAQSKMTKELENNVRALGKEKKMEIKSKQADIDVLGTAVSPDIQSKETNEPLNTDSSKKKKNKRRRAKKANKDVQEEGKSPDVNILENFHGNFQDALKECSEKLERVLDNAQSTDNQELINITSSENPIVNIKVQKQTETLNLGILQKLQGNFSDAVKECAKHLDSLKDSKMSKVVGDKTGYRDKSTLQRKSPNTSLRQIDISNEDYTIVRKPDKIQMRKAKNAKGNKTNSNKLNRSRDSDPNKSTAIGNDWITLERGPILTKYFKEKNKDKGELISCEELQESIERAMDLYTKMIEKMKSSDTQPSPEKQESDVRCYDIWEGIPPELALVQTDSDPDQFEFHNYMTREGTSCSFTSEYAGEGFCNANDDSMNDTGEPAGSLQYDASQEDNLSVNGDSSSSISVISNDSADGEDEFSGSEDENTHDKQAYRKELPKHVQKYDTSTSTDLNEEYIDDFEKIDSNLEYSTFVEELNSLAQSPNVSQDILESVASEMTDLLEEILYNIKVEAMRPTGAIPKRPSKRGH